MQGDGRTEKGAAASAQNIRRGVMKDFKPKGAFETAVDGTTVYVRFVGDPEPERPAEESTPADDKGDDDKGDDDKPERVSMDGPQLPVAAPAEVRAWARGNGWNVPDRGRMEQRVYDAYYEAQRRQSRHVRVVRPEDDEPHSVEV